MAPNEIAEHRTPAEFYRRNGYYIFRGALGASAVDAFLQAIDQEVVQSDVKFRRHPHHEYQSNIFVEEHGGRQVVSNALIDPHRQPETPVVANAIRELICTDNVADLVRSVDGAVSHTIHQTIVFFIPPGTDMHMDGWGLDSRPFGYSHTLWIPLERVTLMNGPLFLVPWEVGRFVSPEELGLTDFLGRGDEGARQDYHEYHDRMAEYVCRHHPECVVPQLEPGDIVMFASLTPHGTMPRSPRFSRVSRCRSCCGTAAASGRTGRNGCAIVGLAPQTSRATEFRRSICAGSSSCSGARDGSRGPFRLAKAVGLSWLVQPVRDRVGDQFGPDRGTEFIEVAAIVPHRGIEQARKSIGVIVIEQVAVAASGAKFRREIGIPVPPAEKRWNNNESCRTRGFNSVADADDPVDHLRRHPDRRAVGPPPLQPVP